MILRLDQLYTPGQLLRDSDGDGLADGIAARLVLAASGSNAANAGALDIAARLGLESLALTLPITLLDTDFPATLPDGTVPVILGPANSLLRTTHLAPGVAAQLVHQPPGVGWVAAGQREGAPVLVVSGVDDQGALRAARYLAAGWPFLRGLGGTTLAGAAAHAGAPVCALTVDATGNVSAVWCLQPDGSALAVDLQTIPAGAAAPAPDDAAAAPPPVVPAGQLAGLEDLFGARGFLRRSQPYFPDRAGFTATVNNMVGVREIAALADLAARVGVEATGFSFPVSRVAGEPTEFGGPVLTVRLAPPAGPQAPGTGVLRLNNGVLLVRGDAPGRVAALQALAQRLPSLGETWAPGGPDLQTLIQGVNDALAGRLPGAALGPLALDLQWQGEWEVDRARRIWAERVLPALAPGQPVQVDLRLSEPADVRAELAAGLERQLQAAGVAAAGVRVRSAYKQGLHWLLEEVIPALQSVSGVARVELACAAFAADLAVAGAGATPDAAPILDMPIRLLQECFPGDELLASALGLPLTAIDFRLAPAPALRAHGGALLLLTATAADGGVLYQAGLRPTWSRRRYLAAYPERGWVHPPTGWLRVCQGERVLVDEPIATDAELFWAYYQNEVLPALRQAVLDSVGEAPDAAAQPFFASLDLHVWLSEEDRRLGVREEQISPLDAMHEDLYFGTLDYFSTWGKGAGRDYDAPGSVLPWVHAGAGSGPRSQIRLYRKQPPLEALPLQASVGELLVDAAGQLAEVCVELAGDAGLQAAAAERLSGLRHPLVTPARAAVAVRLGEAVVAQLGPDSTPLLPAPAAIIDTEVIGPDQLPAQLATVAGLPGVQAWQAGVSFAGRPIYALAVRPPLPEAIRPLLKAAAWKPTLLLNGRHHANEVSSTPAHLLLAQRAATDPAVARLISQVNLVLLPMANPDGAATHHAMQAEHPNWKLHAARFNAVGLEFRKHSARADTPFTEARALPELWWRTLPDVLLDDHGYPSHEWVQPFAGYNSPPYFPTSWWAANALIYGIWSDPDDPLAMAVLQDLEAAVAALVGGEPEIAQGNQVLLERYRKYGHAFVPERFPLRTQGEFISTHHPRQGWSAPHAAITPVFWVTEVPDETAQGEYLQVCIRAHLAADLATLQWLAGQPQPLVREAVSEGNRRLHSIARPRPLVLRPRS